MECIIPLFATRAHTIKIFNMIIEQAQIILTFYDDMCVVKYCVTSECLASLGPP